MPNPPVKWTLIVSLLWTSATLAASGIRISAMESPVWTQQDAGKSALTSGGEDLLGKRLLTGDSGRLALELEKGTRLQVDVNSEIELITSDNPEAAAAGPLAAIKIHRGRVCVQFRRLPEENAVIELLAADIASVAFHELGDICVTLGEDQSSIALAEGTVQITNLVEPAMVVLSEAGSEYRFDDTGYFELDKIETVIPIEVSSEAITQPEAATVEQTTATTAEAAAATEAAATTEVSETGSSEGSSPYVYTVYLFSTRSQEVANEVDQRLKDAGHQTLIITSEDGSATRYRVAVSGFTSRQLAQDFSAAIIGKYGIADTWIGRRRTTP